MVKSNFTIKSMPLLFTLAVSGCGELRQKNGERADGNKIEGTTASPASRPLAFIGSWVLTNGGCPGSTEEKTAEVGTLNENPAQIAAPVLLLEIEKNRLAIERLDKDGCLTRTESKALLRKTELYALHFQRVDKCNSASEAKAIDQIQRYGIELRDEFLLLTTQPSSSQLSKCQVFIRWIDEGIEK